MSLTETGSKSTCCCSIELEGVDHHLGVWAAAAAAAGVLQFDTRQADVLSQIILVKLSLSWRQP